MIVDTLIILQTVSINIGPQLTDSITTNVHVAITLHMIDERKINN